MTAQILLAAGQQCRGERVAIALPEVEVGGKTTYVLVEQTAAVQPERLGRIVGHLSHQEMSMVDRALRVVLDLT